MTQEHFDTAAADNLEGGRHFMASEEIEQFLKEEEEITKEVIAAEQIIEKSRQNLELSEDTTENPRYRDLVDKLNETSEGKEILEALYSLEDEILSIMEKFLHGEKKSERAIALLVHAHREIKRMRTGGK